jgi:hypothetical protein
VCDAEKAIENALEAAGWRCRAGDWYWHPDLGSADLLSALSKTIDAAMARAEKDKETNEALTARVEEIADAASLALEDLEAGLTIETEAPTARARAILREVLDGKEAGK